MDALNCFWCDTDGDGRCFKLECRHLNEEVQHTTTVSLPSVHFLSPMLTFHSTFSWIHLFRPTISVACDWTLVLTLSLCLGICELWDTSNINNAKSYTDLFVFFFYLLAQWWKVIKYLYLSPVLKYLLFTSFSCYFVVVLQGKIVFFYTWIHQLLMMITSDLTK